VEYILPRINQVQVNSAIDLSFASILRSTLRHDPDVIMIGETRDAETAQMAMQASLTGHFVMTTLHTNDAPGAITRLIDMGLDPLMIATTLEGILAQRLVRKLCPICRISYPSENFSSEELTFFDMNVLPPQLYTGKGCDACNNSGYQGRVDIFEFLTINDELRMLINEKCPHYQLRTIAIKHGMISLRIECDRYVREGITTVNEINRSIHTSVG
jgi:type II secretory ATPase GspE/PulE/Tfp pilus assembly ATPase PilB-like protein